MPTALIILPNQLFDPHPGLDPSPDKIILFEDPLFFGDAQYPARLHKQKLWLHRASMARYLAALKNAGHDARIHPYEHSTKAADNLIAGLDATDIIMAHPVDHTAERRLTAAAKAHDVSLEFLDTPAFLNTQDDNDDWSKGRKRWCMA